jgi:hypothetical protein
MTSTKALKLDAPSGPGDAYTVAVEKLIHGNPQQTIWTQYTDGTEKFFTGVWSSEPGKWKISYTEEEFCYMLEGTSIIESTEGEALTVKAGESFVIPRGFVGTWEVVERTTKRFVIYEQGS